MPHRMVSPSTTHPAWGNAPPCKRIGERLASVRQAGVERVLQEGDVVIGVNGARHPRSQPTQERTPIRMTKVAARCVCAGEPVVHETLHEAIGKVAGQTITLTFLRPKGKIMLAGASVTVGGGRKQGGYTLQLSTNDSGSRRSRHTLICADERSCYGWVSSIKEAIAAAAMETIKTTVSGRATVRFAAWTVPVAQQYLHPCRGSQLCLHHTAGRFRKRFSSKPFSRRSVPAVQHPRAPAAGELCVHPVSGECVA
jgi:hypothetical protein